LEILIKNAQRKYKVDSRKIKRYIGKVQESLGGQETELSILFVNDDRIRKLNSQYRNIDKPTDVLSFPQDDDPSDETGVHLLGDVVVSMETAKRQAKQHHLTFEEEVVLLILHGTLHLLGYDHEKSPREEKKMRRETQKLFEAIFPGRQPAATSNF
jgi:probable rRNA maturation factor